MATSKKPIKPSDANAKKQGVPMGKKRPNAKASAKAKSQQSSSSAVDVLSALLSSENITESKREVVFEELMTLLKEKGNQEVRTVKIENDLAELEVKNKAKEAEYGIDLIIKVTHSIILPTLIPMLAALCAMVGMERTSTLVNFCIFSGVFGGPVVSWYGIKRLKLYLSDRKKKQDDTVSIPSAIPSSI